MKAPSLNETDRGTIKLKWNIRNRRRKNLYSCLGRVNHQKTDMIKHRFWRAAVREVKQRRRSTTITTTPNKHSQQLCSCITRFWTISLTSTARIPKGDGARDDSQRRVLARHSVAMLEQCCNHSKQSGNNVAPLCWPKNRRCELSRVTSPSCNVSWRTWTYISIKSLRIHLQAKIAFFRQIEPVQIDPINFEGKLIFLATFSRPSSLSLLKLPEKWQNGKSLTLKNFNKLHQLHWAISREEIEFLGEIKAATGKQTSIEKAIKMFNHTG